jgi:hypothetical protein
MVDCFNRGLIALPPSIEVLRLDAHEDSWGISLGQQQQAIAYLSEQYPLLREVQFGVLSTKWKRSGDLWKSRSQLRT